MLFITGALALSSFALAVNGIGLDKSRCAPNSGNCTCLNVFSANVYNFPTPNGGKYTSNRIKALGQIVAKAEYDLYLLQELWWKSAHEELQKFLPAGFQMTTVAEMSSMWCVNIILPFGCSGLAIISRYPFQKMKFDVYKSRGSFFKMFSDGEVLAGKGIGMVSIDLPDLPGTSVDVFNTHLISNYTESLGHSNLVYQTEQVDQLLNKHILASTADAVILAGDLNIMPDLREGSLYTKICDAMQSCLYSRQDQSLQSLFDDTNFTTSNHPANTFKIKGQSEILDYVIPMATHRHSVDACYDAYDVVPRTMTVASLNKVISLSDHEAVTAEIRICKS